MVANVTDKEKTASVLNSIVEINSDRIEGYQKAAEDTTEADLKTLFADFATTSVKNKEQVALEVYNLNGKPTDGTHTSSMLHRAWIDLKALVTSNDRVSILNSCEFGDTAAVTAYDKALTDHKEDLTLEQIRMLTAQRATIVADLDKIKFLRDMLKEEKK